jgi:hypothetical protein
VKPAKGATIKLPAADKKAPAITQEQAGSGQTQKLSGAKQSQG